MRYAVLAPSSHNTQPWKFSIADDLIGVFMDESRWLKVADDDQRELHISIGWALENLLVAAEHFGLGHQTNYLPDPTNPLHAATVRIVEKRQPSTECPADLFPMIAVRHTNHGEYDGGSIPAAVLEQLRSCCVKWGITVLLTSDESIRQVDELVVRADAVEFADPAFRAELGHWIGQGVFGTSWLMSKIGKLAVTHINMGASTAKKDSAVLMSSPVLGLISSESNDRVTQIKVGQVCQRLCGSSAGRASPSRVVRTRNRIRRRGRRAMERLADSCEVSTGVRRRRSAIRRGQSEWRERWRPARSAFPTAFCSCLERNGDRQPFSVAEPYVYKTRSFLHGAVVQAEIRGVNNCDHGPESDAMHASALAA